MNKYRYYIFVFATAFYLSACSNDFLNTLPLDQVSSTATWSDAALSEAFVTDVYNGLGNGGLDEQMLSSLTDESIFTHPGRGINVINEATLNADNLGWVSGTYEWGTMYREIRAANLAIESLLNVASFDDPSLNERLRGESYFLRAYFYHQLLRYYGGIPIIDKPYNLDDDFQIERSSFSDVVEFIVKDCDSSAFLLNGKNMALGRANSVGAMALKARVLLYAASDLHDIPTASANSSLLSSYSKKEILGYTQGGRVQRWQRARDAAKEVLDSYVGYKTDLTSPVSEHEGTINYISLAMGGGSAGPEIDPAAGVDIIFGRYFSPNKDEGGEYVGRNNGPNGYHNWAGNTPIGQMVDSYRMNDGSKFDWTNAAQKANPYENRDPRLYGTILYDGADWKPRDIVSGNVDPANQIQSGHYELTGGAMLGGLDTRESSIEDWNGSWTGYYFRKFTDPDPSVVEQTGRQFVPWPILRYTEMMMNYAEACIELGQESEALEWINKIRFRAGMPAINLAGPALKDEYRNERKVELAYEEQRYHDVRRWMIAPQALGQLPLFINVTGLLKPGQSSPSVYRYDKQIYNYTYVNVANSAIENRKWDDKMYFRPIGRDEINRNSLLDRNPGYGQ